MSVGPLCDERRPCRQPDRGATLLVQPEVQAFGTGHGILAEALVTDRRNHPHRDGQHTSTVRDPVIGGVAQAHGKTPAQVMLRWGVQHGALGHPEAHQAEPHRREHRRLRLRPHPDEMAALDALDTGLRGGPEPNVMTLEAFGRDIPEA